MTVRRFRYCVSLLCVLIAMRAEATGSAIHMEAQAELVADSLLPSPVPPEPGQFTWVLFSAPELNRAEEVSRIFENKGVGCHILRDERGDYAGYRVVHGAYANYPAAMVERDVMMRMAGDAWVLGVTEAMLPVSERMQVMSGGAGIEGVSKEKTPAEKPVDTVSEVPRTPVHRLFEADVQFGNVYDSNIDHDDTHIGSYGYVPSLHVRLFSAVEDPLFTFDYTVARHAYSNTERWDRVSNRFNLTFAPEFADRFRGETTAEVSLKGSSEDRDLSNQYQVVQEFEYRITREHRLYLYGTLRLKRFPESPLDNAFKPNAGVIYQRRMDGGERVSFEARYERNIEEDPEEGYSRWTYGAEYRTAVGRRGTQLQLEATYRSKLYDLDLVELDDVDYLRHDQQWSMEAEVVQRLSRNIQLLLGYKYEFRNSNDPEKYFDANLIELMISYRL